MPFREDFDIRECHIAVNAIVQLTINTAPGRQAEAIDFLLSIPTALAVSVMPGEDGDLEFLVRTNTKAFLVYWCNQHLAPCEAIVGYHSTSTGRRMLRESPKDGEAYTSAYS